MSKSRGKNLKVNAKELPRRSAPNQELSADEQRLAAANQQLRASNQELRAREEISQIFETAADGMLVIDRDFNVIRANQTFADLVGLAKEEIVGKRCYDVFGGPLCHSQNCPLKRILAGQERFESETEKHRPDGGKIPCILTATAFRRADGEIIGIVEDFKDITERKQAEEALRTLNYDLRERVKELDCLYGISNLVDQADISLDEIYQGIVDLIPLSWQYSEITCARISTADKEFKTQNFRETNWRQSSCITVRNQEIGTIEVSYLEEKPQSDEGPFLSEERKLINAISERLSHIIEHKQAEEALLRALNDDLTSTADTLEEANRELRDFVYIASHDLREPLRKISSFGELLKGSLQDKLKEDDRENLEFMIDGAERMTQMIEGLLTYSRLNTRQAQLEPVDLNEIVEQLRHLELAVMLEETDGEIEIPQLLPKVTAEPAQARQLMQNLIANGIKYRRQGIPPRIVITAEQLDSDNVRVEVRDNGIGIKDEYQRGIFKMFKRLHSRREYDGAGIGLAVCKKIVEEHNGSIGVESKQGQGSVFWFTLAPAQELLTVS